MITKKIFLGKLEKYSIFSLFAAAYKSRYNFVIGENDVFKDGFGKPRFKDKNMPCFNISHSGEFIVCAFDEDEIGIDIQKIRSIPDSVVKKYLKTDSKDPVIRITEWTKFESFGKRLGTGIPYDEDYSQGHFYSTDEAKGYIITVCLSVENVQATELVFI